MRIHDSRLILAGRLVGQRVLGLKHNIAPMSAERTSGDESGRMVTLYYACGRTLTIKFWATKSIDFDFAAEERSTSMTLTPVFIRGEFETMYAPSGGWSKWAKTRLPSSARILNDGDRFVFVVIGKEECAKISD